MLAEPPVSVPVTVKFAVLKPKVPMAFITVFPCGHCRVIITLREPDTKPPTEIPEICVNSSGSIWAPTKPTFFAWVAVSLGSGGAVGYTSVKSWLGPVFAADEDCEDGLDRNPFPQAEMVSKVMTKALILTAFIQVPFATS